MNREITELGAYPYRAVAHLYVTFPDGSVALGTGALVGRNDVLTATHVLYNPDAGGWARDVRIALGADYNTATYRYESPSLVDLHGSRWDAYGFPAQTFADGANQTLTFTESQSDVALIGLSVAAGDQLGYFAMAPGYDSSQVAYQIGYPQGSSGMIYGALSVQHNASYAVYQAYTGGSNQLMGPGSSGGPLFVFDNGVPTIIGVRSSGNDTSAYWADVGYSYPQLVSAMAANDELLPVWMASSVVSGTAGNDVLYATNSADQVSGRDGLDTLVFASPHTQYRVVLGAEGAVVASRALSDDVDHLIDVERLSFSDGVLAIDVGLGEAAGGAYRLYQSAFDRQPDVGGFNYWIQRIDAGMSLRDVAQSFVDSIEFGARYGTQVSNEQLITNFYLNVLDRSPDPGGYAYWQTQMRSGLSEADVLGLFAESTENQIRVIGALDEGVWLS
ncbi:DUF4214 domain-containing protein [Stutzerimonas kunmingensis]|uniref:DUF4214 domain-containing protein n=1 Tax=Stutzerimonas kunmingensis TaxID=1211807 RepID=UPI002430D2D8|nr:DUF4214 domain-containing protein [Stutzerimonas kunmingensis]